VAVVRSRSVSRIIIPPGALPVIRPTARLPLLAALLALAGCSDLLGSSGPQVYLSLGTQRALPAAVTLRVEANGHAAEVATIGPVDEQPPSYFNPGRYGETPVQLELRGASGTVIGTFEFTQEFQRDVHHWLVVALGTSRPIGLCIGTLTAVGLPAGALDGNPASADSMFVMRGSLPEGAIC
jgi:hypothetical protein